MKRAAAMLLAIFMCITLSTCAFPEEPPPPDYLSVMLRAVRQGDAEKGREAEYLRNSLIDEKKLDEPKVYYDELLLLSKFIQSQAGSIWLTDEFLFCTGEVVMNRVASPDFPDSISEVIYQEGQYEGVLTEEFQCHLLPSSRAAQAALRLLLGERMMSEDVVYASDKETGELYALYSDARLGYTYFCTASKAD